ncbi:hypothetical protein E2C01_051762 [Portunus trituberculatus]|uniref:Uncharacterized protein n=1 Tax=Portunus trituberculatus TaxID=210409 RepID=A0A5B7GJX9_PORTR|nr:hypothetical protein [Portunus trituberculatus]
MSRPRSLVPTLLPLFLLLVALLIPCCPAEPYEQFRTSFAR